MRTTQVRRAAAFLAACAVVALLGVACSGDGAEEPTDTPAAASTATPDTSTPDPSTPAPGGTVVGSPVPPSQTRPPDGTATPPVVLPDDRVEVEAPIVRVDLIVAESFPPQYFAKVVSAQPDGCHQFSRFEVARDGTTIAIHVYNTQPKDLSVVSCLQVYSETTSNVALGSDFAPSVEHKLDVNGKIRTFVAQ